MKNKLVYLCLTTLLSIASLYTAHEAYAEEVNPNQLVIVDPDGGYFSNLDGSSTFSESTVEQVGGVVMSLSDYERIEEKKEAMVDGTELFAPIMLRSADPFNKPVKVIPDRMSYTSQEFSGNGWRFSGYRFLPARGTGIYLAWRVEKDAGRVGLFEHARNTYHGRLQGVSVDVGQRPYVASDTNGLYFYTYNPKLGSKYIVENW